MADDLSLLFKLRADNAQAKAVMGDTRAAVTALRGQFGKDLTQMQGVARTAISDIGENVNAFVGQRIPLIGGVFQRVTSNLRGLNDELKKGGPQTAKLAQQIDGIAKASGKSTAEVSRFLTAFVRLEGQAKRDAAALEFVGAAAAQKLIPQLEQAGAQLAVVAGSAGSAGSALAGMATPIGIAVVALAAMALGAAAVAKQIFDLTKQAAAFQGRLADLSQQTNVSVESLSAMEVAIKQNGGEIGGVVQALVSFQRKLDDAQDPLSKTAEQFRKFNIAANDTESALRQAFVALAAMPPGFAQTNAAAELFGTRGGKNMLLILKQMGGDLDGAIAKLREMGIVVSDDAARAADTFNDELELLNFQIRALSAVAARDLIPAMIDVVRGMGELVRAVRPVVSLFSTLAGPVVRSVGENLKNLGIIVRTLTGDYLAFAESIKRAREEQEIKPVDIPALSPVSLPRTPTPQQTASEAVTQAEAVVAAVKRIVAEQAQTLAEAAQQGRRTREQDAAETVEFNRKVLAAEQQRIDALLQKKEQEFRALDQAQKDRGEVLNRDTDAYRAITAEVNKLQQERLDKENAFEVSARAIRSKVAKESADARRNDIRNTTDLIANELDRQIKAIEAQITRGEQEEESGLTVVEKLEQAKVDARIDGLEEQKRIGFLTVQEQIDLNAELQKLIQERDRLADEQAQRRLDRERAAGQRAVDIALANIETLLRLEQIAGHRRIDTIQQLTDLRVISEEEAAKRILKIRLDLIDDEIEALNSRLKAAGTIADKDERIRTQAELNNQIKVLTEERISIETDGFREIDEGRRRDLENERRYADELVEIRERVKDIELDAAEEAIRLMRSTFARRKDIIRAQRDLELAEEADRHRRATESINRQKQEADAEIATLEKRLESLTIGTTEEIEQYERIIAALERLRLKRLELDAQQTAENERSKTRQQGINFEAGQNEEDADPFGRLRTDLEDVKEFADELEQTIVPLGEILTSTFLEVADAIGQTVANWVLLGETGSAVMRKILAQALASIAAEAAVNAIKELALGFATLFFNPAESAAHFKAAALWGAIGGVAAVAGRGVAGDLFKQKTSSTSAGSGSQDRGQLSPLTLPRNQPQTVHVVIHQDIKTDGGQIVRTWTDDYQKGGVTREIIANDGRT